ncbi:MAG: hypothetical protein JOZ90_07505 [Alphaproteobacteria bacterium]|nr:hypothetical protein [Alphaproteobacteria bacterium]MBV9371883.1 hypothetical protein [Alphaproteobacteria bacterium]MBV9900929.1 hypothetical protein [Alphaproteobacteria bacterium]
MLMAVVLIGFAVLAFQLNALRILFVKQIKQTGILVMLVEQIDGIDGTGLGERMQAEIDIAAGKYG